MKDKDIFAGIAAGGATRRTDLLSETLPLEKPTEYFRESIEKLDFYKEKEHSEKLIDYRKGLDKLKARYAPFLQRKCKSVKSTRTKIYLTDFSFNFKGSSDVENIQIPHYTGPKGRWTAYYETEFTVDKPDLNRRIFIVFKGVDYYADVFVNNIQVCSHEGFFASFECDITDQLHKINKLTIKVKNDIPTIGNGDMQVNGDKLYAATGLGWDDPEEGWHHCPAGGGIFDKVFIEERDSRYIDDVFIKPDIDGSAAEINIALFSSDESNSTVDFSIEIMPFNFDGKSQKTTYTGNNTGYGLNYYSHRVDINSYKMWEPEYPYLYLCRVTAGGDVLERTFGMRKFHMDEEGELKGSLFLNNQPILLRGANEMGHLQLCVMRDDYDQLIEDIMIAKYCNMNYYRITQRPVQEEIYHYCDMLGMLNQADLPLFGYMRKNKFYEGVKQAGEMERLIRNHPSVIMSTYINEPFAPEKYGLAYRHMSRPDLELFFDACDAAVYFENPDRVIKRVEGDYDPPTNKGLSDFHCYNMWYTNHALPIGMLYKGYLPAQRIGWKTGCGEYGAEGLDNYDVMRKYYPDEWLPENDGDYWLPDNIVKAQSNTMHGDWYEAQTNIQDWIEQSQIHQAFATQLMTLAFRRRSDKVISTAIHLLIDAWPSGWMKTLLDVDRVPKKAYFSFKESLVPLKINLRSDRWSAYSGEIINIEAWVLNDGKSVENMYAVAAVFADEQWVSGFSMDINDVNECESRPYAIIPVKIPDVTDTTKISVQIDLFKKNETVSRDRLSMVAYPKNIKNISAFPIGDVAKTLIDSTYGLVSTNLDNAECVVVSSSAEYKNADIPENCKKIFLTPEEENKTYILDGLVYNYKTIFDPEEVGENGELKGLSFTALSDQIKTNFNEKSFSYWYNKDKDFIDHVAEYYIEGAFENPLVFGYEKPSWGIKTVGEKRKLPVAAKQGNNIFVSFETKGRSGVNPALDKLIILMLTEAVD